MKKANNRIILTGGHAGTTALAVVEEIKKENLDWEIHWIGSKNSIEGKKLYSFEYSFFSKLDVFLHTLIAGRLQRKFTVWTIPSLFKIPIGFVQSIYYLIKIKPFVVLSFGGYASFPVVLASKIFNVPVVVHEQTAAVGRANKLSAKLADKVLISKEDSRKYFSSKKVMLVGNPILSKYFDIRTKIKNKNTILIIGGSRGSQKINRIVKEILNQLLEKYEVIHLTGHLDFKSFINLKENLPKDLSNKYHIYSQIEPYQMVDIYNSVDLVIARAGANTVSELIALKKPTIFIPIPWSYLNEQRKNAEHAFKYIPTTILDQDNISGKSLLTEISLLENNKSSFPESINIDKDASKNIIKILKEYLR